MNDSTYESESLRITSISKIHLIPPELTNHLSCYLIFQDNSRYNRISHCRVILYWGERQSKLERCLRDILLHDRKWGFSGAGVRDEIKGTVSVNKNVNANNHNSTTQTMDE